MKISKLDVIIVDPQPDCRMRMKQVATAISNFRNIKLFDKLSSALELLGNKEESCDIVFVAERFGEEKIAEFRKEAERTIHGISAAYVLLLDPRHQKANRMASSIQQGMDALLFEPYSTDGVNEIIPIACSVHQDRVKVQEKAAFMFLVKEALGLLDKVSSELVNDRSPVREWKNFKDVAKGFANIESDMLERYFEVLIMETQSSKPAPDRSSVAMYEGASNRVRERMRRVAFRKMKLVEDLVPKEEEEQETVNEAEVQRQNKMSESFYIIRKC